MLRVETAGDNVNSWAPSSSAELPLPNLYRMAEITEKSNITLDKEFAWPKPYFNLLKIWGV